MRPVVSGLVMFAALGSLGLLTAPDASARGGVSGGARPSGFAVRGGPRGPGGSHRPTGRPGQFGHQAFGHSPAFGRGGRFGDGRRLGFGNNAIPQGCFAIGACVGGRNPYGYSSGPGYGYGPGRYGSRRSGQDGGAYFGSGFYGSGPAYGAGPGYGHGPYEFGAPVAIGIRPPPVRPPAIYVIGARGPAASRARPVTSRRRAGGPVVADSRAADQGSGVVGAGPQIIRLSGRR